MTYYDTLDKKRYDELGRLFALFTPYSLDRKQLEHSDIVADEILTHYDKRTITDDNDISYKKLLMDTKKLFMPEGIGFAYVGGTVNSILSSVKFSKHMSIYDYDFTVISDIAYNGSSYYKIPNVVILPEYFTLASVHFLVHETTHILKELNPMECMGIYSDEEVIPIAIELISAFESKNFDVFKKREYLMKDMADLYIKLTRDKSHIAKEDIVGFTSCYRKCIMYLNSFYYSLRLFSMYLDAPKYVLGIIDDVLSHRLTTRDVINHYLSNDDYNYESGIEQFRSRLK